MDVHITKLNIAILFYFILFYILNLTMYLTHFVEWLQQDKHWLINKILVQTILAIYIYIYFF